MVTLNHVKHRPVRSNASLLIPKNWKEHQPEKPQMRMMRRLWTVTHQEYQPPMAPLLSSIRRTGRDTTTSRLFATWMGLSPTLQVRSLNQRGTSRFWHRPLLHIEMEPSLWPGFANPLREKGLRQAYGGLLLSLCQGPADMAIQASLTRRKHILETVKKWEL